MSNDDDEVQVQRSVPRLRNRRPPWAHTHSHHKMVALLHDGSGVLHAGSKEYQQPEPSRRKHHDIDGGWGKVVVLALFGSFFINTGLLSCVGVYYAKLLEVFGKSRSHTSWVGSLLNAFVLLVGPVSALFISRWGCRNSMRFGSLLMCLGYYVSAFAVTLELLFFTYGVVVACGMNFVYAGHISALNLYFDRYLHLATSFAMVGIGVGVFLLNMWTEHVIQEYGWRGSFIWNAGLSLQIFVLGSLIYPIDVPHDEQTRTRERSFSPMTLSAEASFTTSCFRFPRNIMKATCSIFKNVCFWLLAVGFFCQVMSTTSIYIIYKDFVTTKGFEEYYARVTIGIGVGDIVGRMSMGVWHTSRHFNPVLAYSVSMLLAGLVIMCHAVANSLPIIYILSTLFGIAYGMQNVLIAIIPEKLFGKSSVTAVFGCILFAGGIGALIGAPVSGVIVDKTGKYEGVLGFSTATLCVGSVVMLMCFCISHNKPPHPLRLYPL